MSNNKQMKSEEKEKISVNLKTYLRYLSMSGIKYASLWIIIFFAGNEALFTIFLR